MELIKTHIKKLFFLLTIFASNAVAQIPTDDTIPFPSSLNTTPLKRMRALAIDSNENKWFGFDKSGLGKYSTAGVWTLYDSLTTPLPNQVLSVCCNASGVWAGTTAGLYNYDGTNWKIYKKSNSNIPSDTVPNLYSPGGNSLFIYSGSGTGSYRIPGFTYFNGTTFTPYTIGNSGLVNDSVQCIFQSSSGIWWIGTIDGLSSFDGTTWQSYTTANALQCTNNILSIVEDKNNILFIGTNFGLEIKSGNNFVQLTNYDRSLPKSSVYCQFKLLDGRIFASYSLSNKEYIISTNPVSIVTKTFNLNFGTPCYVVMDKSERLWWTKTFPASNLIRLTDSLQYYPNDISVNNPENYRYNYLDINKVRCGMGNDNRFFWTGGNAEQDYEVPQTQCGSKALFASALWIGGMDASNNLRLAAQTYRQSGDDFWPGPVDTINTLIDPATKIIFDSTWKINKSLVDTFRMQYMLGNVTSGSYKIPNIIANWPAHGSGNYSRYLAPFVDYNADGIYDPYDGDYPKVKGDQMLWWVMNDIYSVHTETGSVDPMGIEVQCRAYAYSCPWAPTSNDAVNYTTFYSDSIINRNTTIDLHDIYLGIWVDADLGYGFDDYIGCRISGDYGFCYNGDNYDEGAAGYGLNPPMISVALLKGPIADTNDGLDNNHNGVIDEPGERYMMNHFQNYENSSAFYGNPFTATQYYNYLQSIWKNQQHVTYGGNGFGGGCDSTLIPANYMYPGMPYDTGWTEANACNIPGDRRFIISSGPFTLKAGESKTLDYAIVFSWDKAHPNGLTTSIAKNDSDVMKVKHWFETDSFPCVNSIGVKEIAANNNDLFIYPNPTQGKFRIVSSGRWVNPVIEITDMLGQVVYDKQFAGRSSQLVRDLDLSELPKGIYMVKVRDAQRATTKKVVVE